MASELTELCSLHLDCCVETLFPQSISHLVQFEDIVFVGPGGEFPYPNGELS